MAACYGVVVAVINTRIDDTQYADLAMVARIDDVSISEAVRVAVTAHIAARTTDPAFQDRLRKLSTDHRETLARLDTARSA